MRMTLSIVVLILVLSSGRLHARSELHSAFGSVSVTNGLSYFRMREFHHGGFVYPDSMLGMNTFSERRASEGQVLESLYGALRFLKYIYPRCSRMAPGAPVEWWSRKGFQRMNGVDGVVRFPERPDSEPAFRGHPFRKLDVVVFPFEVANRTSDNTLDMILLKFHYGAAFVGAVYYNCNTSDADFSFLEASGCRELVGQESDAPYLSHEEEKTQKGLCTEMFGRFRYVGPETVKPQKTCEQQEVEVVAPDL